MTIQDAIRSERETMKNRPLKDKIAYFWEYHKAIILGVVVVLSMIGAYVISVTGQKEMRLCSVFMDTSPMDETQVYMDAFGEVVGMDPNVYDFFADTSYYLEDDNILDMKVYDTLKMLGARVSVNEVDTIAGKEQYFLEFAYQEYFVDLRTVLTEQQLADFAPYILYVDEDIIQLQKQMADNLEIYTEAYPDPKNPDAMGNPIPVGLDMAGATDAFGKALHMLGDSHAIGIVRNSLRTDTAIQFVLYVFGKLDVSMPA